ncbi:MAG: alpha-L-fucosidase, partial [Candidatus Kryptoniota bacterium]
MNRIIRLIAIIFLFLSSAYAGQHPDNRMQWWRDARFGMFIHWGIYAVPAKGEWYMTDGHVPRPEYEKYASQFNPADFDADDWVKIAHYAGMKYLVVTSKHHDGFCMFNTKATRYNVVQATPWHKDPLKALSEACSRYNIKFCVYYSIMDWHSPDQEADIPDSAHPTYNPTHFKPGKKEAYIDYVKTELKELVTQYHPSVLWFDGGWMDGWTNADGQNIYNYLRRLDPKLIINDRLTGAGDYETPEQQIPPNGIPDKDWETCMTINDSWGFNAADSNFKSEGTLLHDLVDIVSKGGNYLLNVGPTSQGVIPQPEAGQLEKMGQWLKISGESIYGTTASPFTTQFSWGRCTQKPGKLFLQVFNWPADGKLVVPGIYSPPRRVVLLANNKKISLEVTRREDALVITVPLNPPDKICSVVELDFTGEAIIYNPPPINSMDTIFIDSLEVSIKTTRDSREVRCTLDGTVPT